MQHVIRPLFCGLALWIASILPGTATDYSATMRDLTSYITNQLQATGASSLGLVLVDSNQVVWATGFGLADPIAGRAADADTVYGYAVETISGFGAANAVAVPADYDGDGKTDPACYRRTDGAWMSILSANGYARQTLAFGGPNYQPAK